MLHSDLTGLLPDEIGQLQPECIGNREKKFALKGVTGLQVAVAFDKYPLCEPPDSADRVNSKRTPIRFPCCTRY